jgi:hypothetical protein
VILETDPGKARSAARAYMKFYLTLPAYQKNLSALGFNQTDLANDGSDRLVDAIIARGDETKLCTRVAAHYKAGATHVCILPMNVAGGLVPDLRTLQALAPT